MISKDTDSCWHSFLKAVVTSLPADHH